MTSARAIGTTSPPVTHTHRNTRTHHTNTHHTHRVVDESTRAPLHVRVRGRAYEARELATAGELLSIQARRDLWPLRPHEPPRRRPRHPQAVILWQPRPARHCVARAPAASRRALELELPADKDVLPAGACDGEVMGHTRHRPRRRQHERGHRLKGAAIIGRADASHPRLEDVVLEEQAHVRRALGRAHARGHIRFGGTAVAAIVRDRGRYSIGIDWHTRRPVAPLPQSEVAPPVAEAEATHLL